MKLLQKINRNYLISSALVLAAGLLVFYFIVNRIASREIIEGLHASEVRIVHELKSGRQVPRLYPLIEVEKTAKTGPATVKDTVIFDPIEGEKEVFKERNTYRNINGQNYHITIRALVVEKEDIVRGIFFSTAAIFLLLVIILYLINKRTASAVWHPFYRNLSELKNFSVKQNNPIKLHKTGITEFDELNQAVSRLTRKVADDYRSLKEFTENASHEIQTPLSVILVNLEEILQKELPEEEMTKIYQVYRAAKQLSALNRHLLLLTKIENGQFPEENILLEQVVKEKWESLKPLADNAGLRATLSMQGQFPVTMNEGLAEILAGNLLSNAIRHNRKGGKIRITVTGNRLEICNTGMEEALPEKEIFSRFAKNGAEGTGLGLAIAKRICDTHHLLLRYAFAENRHCFTVTLKNAKNQ